MSRWLAFVGLVTLLGCTPTLNNQEIEAQIQAELGQEEDLLLKAVTCPNQVAIAAETSFTCMGELDPEGSFPIRVTQVDDQGSIEWEIPNSRGLLNLATLETEIQAAIATETSGSKPLLDCGGEYRVNQPGDRFECKVTNAAPVKDGQTETLLLNVVVQLDSSGNISWQQIRRQQTLASTTSSAATTNLSGNAVRDSAPGSAPNQPQSAEQSADQPAATGAPEAGQTAEEFLNNPGAIDDF